MSLDPPFTAEFANAGFLPRSPRTLQTQFRGAGASRGAVDAATWEDQLVVAPFWSNTQVLWYRKSFAEKAGLDMTQPVTWDQIINAAADNGGTVGVQANKYEGYSVWINALISGAGGEIATEHRGGRGRHVDIDSDAGHDAAEVDREAGRLHRRASRPVGLQRGHRPARLRRPTQGAFMVNWTFICNNYERRSRLRGRRSRTSAARATRRPSRARSRSRRTAASASASSAYSEHKDLAMRGHRVHHHRRRTR